MSHVEIVVLAEDKPQQQLLRAALKKLNLHRRLTIASAVLGQNDNWVRSELLREVPLLRKAHHLRAVVAVTDADDMTVQTRKEWLEEVLDKPRSAEEKIVYVIPRRHIETWMWYLEGNSVDEAANYKKEKGGPVKKDHDLAVVKRRFAEYIVTGQEPFPDCPPSMLDARVELNRLRL
jgi:hypothetical protein